MIQAYEVWRLYNDKPGCVDFLGTVQADSLESAEITARLVYPCDWGRGERLDVTVEDERERE